MSTPLTELILYIAKQMEAGNHAGRGRIKLAKLVWLADFSAYWELGKPLTEAAYIADKHGPKFENEKALTDAMIESGEFKWESGFDRQKLPKALRDPVMDSFFNAEQMAIIDRQIQENRHLSGSALSNRSHEFPGYKHAWAEGRGTPIPFESVFWENRITTTAWEEELAAELAPPAPAGA
jgi:hypothetical protein